MGRTLSINKESSMPDGESIQNGLIFHQSGQLQKAEDIYNKILETDPDNQDALFLLGAVSYKMKNSGLAMDLFNKALSIDPDYAEAHFSLAIILNEHKDIDGAISHYEKALKIRNDYAEAHNNIGSIFREQGKIDKAIYHFERAIKAVPAYPEAYFNLGDLLYNTGRSYDAMTIYEKAISIKPDYAEVHNNMGTILVEEGRFNDAMAHYEKALQTIPDLATAHFNKALLLLMLGDYEKGWIEYEWRWKAKDIVKQIFPNRRTYSQPLWDGSDIRGKTILLYDEQGFGDTIQFIRYAPLVAEEGAKVIVECHAGLKNLIKNMKGIHHVAAHGDDLPDYDLMCPLMSLPLIFKATIETIPSRVPYLSVDPISLENWHSRLELDNSRFKIGIVWTGRKEHKYNRNRSYSIEMFLPLLKIKDSTFYSLQKGDVAREIYNLPEEVKIINCDDLLMNFSDTTALIQNLDLVITVDTAVAHLAGALGKPVWVLLPFVPDWRWLLNREDSPWYPTMRLFRQSTIGNRDTVIMRIHEELLKLFEGAKSA